jgi:hypothetical protein
MTKLSNIKKKIKNNNILRVNTKFGLNNDTSTSNTQHLKNTNIDRFKQLL